MSYYRKLQAARSTEVVARRRAKRPADPIELRSTIAGVTGALLLVAAYALGKMTMGTSGWTVARANGLCTSAFGQLAQLNPRAAAACTRAATYEQLHGWLIIAGVLLIIAGVTGGIYVGYRNSQTTVKAAA